MKIGIDRPLSLLAEYGLKEEYQHLTLRISGVRLTSVGHLPYREAIAGESSCS